MSIIGNRGLDLIKKFEGVRLRAYKDPVGIWTIGYGHTKDVRGGQTITESEADQLLKEDMIEAQDGVRRVVKSPLSIFQYDALTSFVFNLGIGNFKSSTLLKKINNNHYDPDIRIEFSKWVYAGGKKLKGLEARRAAEADLYFK